MIRAELMGGHTHSTIDGLRVHVWRRGDKYLARGRLHGRSFGETLGGDLAGATARLRQMLNEIENGSYVRPSEARRRPLGRGGAARLDMRQLVSGFLAEKRKVRGRKTAETYKSRLMPVLDFAELPAHRRRWPLAMDIDRDFVVELRSFLVNFRTTRNGRSGGTLKPLSVRQVFNILECLRSALAWARRADDRKLPVEWSNPLTPDLIGSPPAKDPLREDKLPPDVRARLVGVMDRWQLCHLAPSLVLPLRPEEAAGLLIGDVDFGKGWLEIGTRIGGGDFTKGRTSFKLPFPDELRPLLRACIGGRAEGPLLRSRRAFEDGRRARPIADREELVRLYERKLLLAPPGSIQAEQDRKQVFRRLLREVGGVSTDRMAAEFKGLLAGLGISNGATLYSLRSSVTTAMKDANLPHLELRYLTGHSTDDILNEYASLDPVRAMRRYFDAVGPLLAAIGERATTLGLTVA